MTIVAMRIASITHPHLMKSNCGPIAFITGTEEYPAGTVLMTGSKRSMSLQAIAILRMAASIRGRAQSPPYSFLG